MKKNKNGITLIALVVTIIILLILAGVAITQLTDSGLFEKGKLAKEKAENAQELQNLVLADYENKIDDYASGTIDNERGNGPKTILVFLLHLVQVLKVTHT